MTKLYIGCSLIFASKEFINFVSELKLELKPYFEILEFVGLNGKTSQEVYAHDRKCVLESDLFLAICDYPSTGLGMEIGFAIENQKKLIIGSKKNIKISKMLLGIPAEKVEFLEYENIEELVEFLKKLI